MSANEHEMLIKRFYTAFAALDADAMQSCYHATAHFEDPAFTLDGREQIGGMWRMLCTAVKAKGADVWKLDATRISADQDSGQAHWEPVYRFSATGRMVHNIIDANFKFKEGLIVSHHDRFDFWRWSRQALGLPGLLLGWTPILRAKVRAKAASNLAAFMRKQA